MKNSFSLLLSVLVFFGSHQASAYEYGCLSEPNFVGGFCDFVDFEVYTDNLLIEYPSVRFALSDAIIQSIAEQRTAAQNAAMQAKFEKLDRIFDGEDFEVGDPDQIEGTVYPTPTPIPIFRTSGRFKFNFKCTYGCNAGASLWENGAMVPKDSEGYYDFDEGTHNVEVRECLNSWLTGTICFKSYFDLDINPIDNVRMVFFDSDDPDVLANPDANGDCAEGQVPVEDPYEKICVEGDDDGGDIDISSEDGYIIIGCRTNGPRCFYRMSTNEVNYYINNGCGPTSMGALVTARIQALKHCPTPNDESAQNAFEHTTWQWIVSLGCGSAAAEAIGNAREAFEGNEGAAMDQHFNALGRSLAAINGSPFLVNVIESQVNANSAFINEPPRTCP